MARPPSAADAVWPCGIPCPEAESGTLGIPDVGTAPLPSSAANSDVACGESGHISPLCTRVYAWLLLVHLPGHRLGYWGTVTHPSDHPPAPLLRCSSLVKGLHGRWNIGRTRVSLCLSGFVGDACTHRFRDASGRKTSRKTPDLPVKAIKDHHACIFGRHPTIHPCFSCHQALPKPKGETFPK